MTPMQQVLVLLYALAFMVPMVFLAGLALAWSINLITGTKGHRHLLSTAGVAVVSFFACFFFVGSRTPLRWVNGQPQNLQTRLWDHIYLISAAIAFVAVVTWQVYVRRSSTD